jgi:hypothetical protein
VQPCYYRGACRGTVLAKRHFIQRLMKHLKWQRHIYVPTTMTFAPLDPTEIKDELELEGRARDRRASNQPPADSGTYDDVESEIIALVERHREIAAHNHFLLR